MAKATNFSGAGSDGGAVPGGPAIPPSQFPLQKSTTPHSLLSSSPLLSFPLRKKADTRTEKGGAGRENSRKIPPFPSGLTAPLPHREGQAVAAVAEAYAIFRHAPASSRATRAVPLPWNSGGRRSQRRRRRRAARSSPPPFFPRSDSFLFFRLERLCCVI